MCNEMANLFACPEYANPSREEMEKYYNSITNPQPLTLDELKQLEGKLIWVVDDMGGRWCIADCSEYVTTNYGEGGWLAYRTPPKEGQR